MKFKLYKSETQGFIALGEKKDKPGVNDDLDLYWYALSKKVESDDYYFKNKSYAGKKDIANYIKEHEFKPFNQSPIGRIIINQ